MYIKILFGLCLKDHHHHHHVSLSAWIFLTLSRHTSQLLSSDPQGYIPYRHRAAVCRFELDVLPLLVHVKESTGVHHSRFRPYFSSSVRRVWFV